ESGAGDGGGMTPCASLPHVVYGAGSSALQKLLARVGGLLSADANPVTFVYLTSASCSGVANILDDTLITGTAQYFDSSGNAHSCALPAAGQLVDIRISDVFATTCRSLPNGLPAEVKENFGPVQIMTFAVPHTSLASSISLEAAYNVFGFGADSQVPPWTSVKYIFQRSASSGTQNMIAATIGVPAAQW